MRAGLLCAILVFALATLCQGCAAAGPSRHEEDAGRDEWIARQGGAANGDVLARATAAADPLLRAYPKVKLRAIRSPHLAAYSWPDGTVAVTEGLVSRLSPNEIAAAVAHEMGHLISDGWVAAPQGLVGRPSRNDDDDVEARADAVGVEVLRAVNVAPANLARAMRKVADDPALDAPQRAALLARARRLEVE